MEQGARWICRLHLPIVAALSGAQGEQRPTDGAAGSLRCGYALNSLLVVVSLEDSVDVDAGEVDGIGV